MKTILDIGASTGRMATLFATAFSEATIHCFEPQTRSRINLREVSYRNPKIQVYPYGLGAENSTQRMRLYERPEGSSFLPIQYYMERTNREIGEEWVEVRRLDDVVDINHVDFMKVDVEGTELEVFCGAERTLERTETVYVEICPMRRGWHTREHIETFDRLHKAGLEYVTVCGDHLFSRDPEVHRLA
jgi:FkbM family methyltransferase